MWQRPLKPWGWRSRRCRRRTWRSCARSSTPGIAATSARLKAAATPTIELASPMARGVDRAAAVSRPAGVELLADLQRRGRMARRGRGVPRDGDAGARARHIFGRARRSGDQHRRAPLALVSRFARRKDRERVADLGRPRGSPQSRGPGGVGDVAENVDLVRSILRGLGTRRLQQGRLGGPRDRVRVRRRTGTRQSNRA